MTRSRSTRSPDSRWAGVALAGALGALLTIAGCQVSGSAQADPAAVSALTGATGTTDVSRSGTSTTPTSRSTDPSTAQQTTAAGSRLTIITQENAADHLIGTIWAQALSHQGFRVVVQLGGSEQKQLHAAVESGAADILPSYTGYALNLYHPNSSGNPGQIYQQLTAALPDGIEALAPAKAESNLAVAVTQQTAKDLRLATMNDFAAHQKPLRLAIPTYLQDADNQITKKRFVDTYRLTGTTITAMGSGGQDTALALSSGKVDAAVVFSLLPDIDTENLVLLTDVKYAFVPDFVVPLVHSRSVDPTARKIIDAVDAKLDTGTLRRLGAELLPGENADTVAKHWLASIGMG
jgi:osmoprotectant transport system substrate-binding protein